MRDTIAAWLAHAYTALGLVCAAAIFGLVVEGGDEAFRLAFALMVAGDAHRRDRRLDRAGAPGWGRCCPASTAAASTT